MIDYITVAIVDDLLGANWQGDGDADQAVLEANVWLSARNLPNDPVPSAVERAGALLAREAANDRLYADRQPNLKREMVDADGVRVEEEYQDGASASTGVMRLVVDLLRPYLPAGGGSTFSVSRA